MVFITSLGNIAGLTFGQLSRHCEEHQTVREKKSCHGTHMTYAGSYT